MKSMIHVSSYAMRKIARIAVFTALIGFLMTACPADVENKTPDPGTVAVPTANPASGAVPLNTEITLETATDGAQIYYTLDGTIPTTGDNLYAADNKPVITAALKLRAMAVKSGMSNSAVMEAEYTILLPGTVAGPTANPASGAVAPNTEITLATATDGAQIYYTLDGTIPTEDDTLYAAHNKPVITETALNLKAIAVKSGMVNSEVMDAVYTMLPPDVTASPMAIPSGGAVAANREITLRAQSEGASIYYTLDGTAPTAASARYSEDNKPRVLKDNCTIRAIAITGGTTSAELNTSYTINTITSETGIKLVQISAGKFMMGSPTTEPNRAVYETQHEVTLTKDFYIGAYEVTQAQYKAVMGNNPSYFKDNDNNPVEQINWYTVLVFCNKLSMQEGLTPVYRIDGKSDPEQWGTIPTGATNKPPAGVDTWDTVEMTSGANGYRLPTEAEWEYACRAGTTTAFNWGANTIKTDQANFDGSTGLYNGSPLGTYLAKTAVVGTFSPNQWGLYDMHGNVFEMCWDLFGEDYYSSEEAGADPAGVSSNSDGRRVLRGGSWFKTGAVQRSAYRERYIYIWQANSRANGMRLVRG